MALSREGQIRNGNWKYDTDWSDEKAMAKKKKDEEVTQQELETTEAKEQAEKAAEPAAEEENGPDLLAQKDQEIAALKNQMMSLAAEYDNFKKRTVREKERIYTDSVGDTVAQLLPVLDNLERALSSFEDKDSEYFRGVDMVLKQTEDVFQKLGVEPIPTVGEEFNPELHNAVMHIEDETVTENTIVEEFQKGYRYKDKVIRYAMVKVAN